MLHRFRHHPPVSEAVQSKFIAIRSKCADLALHINDNIPEGREKSLAITHLEEVMFWANAAIARNQPVPESSKADDTASPRSS